MKTLRFLAFLLVLVLLCSAPRRSQAEPPAVPENKANAEHSQLRDRPTAGQSIVEPQPGSVPSPPATDRTLLGLSIAQIAALVAVFVLFVFSAIWIRWLTTPAEEVDPQTAAGPQDVPQ